MTEKEVFDVLVLGGGLAGLSAALALRDEGMQNVVVLEARDRVRTVTCFRFFAVTRPSLGRWVAGPFPRSLMECEWIWAARTLAPRRTAC
jgi:flavin-dependent dehydrogenase